MSTVEPTNPVVQDPPQTTVSPSHGHAVSTAGRLSTFLSTYVFSKDHKVIGLQFLFSTLLREHLLELDFFRRLDVRFITFYPDLVTGLSF